MSAAELLPWHEPLWQRLRAQMSAGKLAHALLITGLPGLGKRQLAVNLAHALLCDRRLPDDRACGSCRACRLAEQGAHPDLFVVGPEEGGRQIKVDQVRALIEQLSLRGQYGGYRVGLIDPADRMNSSAANALLKTLEEPPAGVLLLLTAARPSLLPATIRSRCQALELAAPAPDVARQWLQSHGAPGAEALLGLANGAPLRALQLQTARAHDRWRSLLATLERLQAGRLQPTAAAADWREVGRDVIPMLIAVCTDLARLRARGSTRFGDLGRLQDLAAAIDLVKLHEYLEQLMELRRHLDHPLNEQLLLESAFIGWQHVARGEHRADAL
jgi:DNA polymerase-3 subunit delta'